jgi:hypothetical protein
MPIIVSVRLLLGNKSNCGCPLRYGPVTTWRCDLDRLAHGAGFDAIGMIVPVESGMCVMLQAAVIKLAELPLRFWRP